MTIGARVVGAVALATFFVEQPGSDPHSALPEPDGMTVLCAGLSPDAALPPVLGRRGDHWPRTVRGKGTVRALVPNSCAGFACDLAQVIIENVVTDGPYVSPDLYGFVSCVSHDDAPRLCNREVRFVARKIIGGREPCGLPKLTFPSQGQPFYMIEEIVSDGTE